MRCAAEVRGVSRGASACATLRRRARGLPRVAARGAEGSRGPHPLRPVHFLRVQPDLVVRQSLLRLTPMSPPLVPRRPTGHQHLLSAQLRRSAWLEGGAARQAARLGATCHMWRWQESKYYHLTAWSNPLLRLLHRPRPVVGLSHVQRSRDGLHRGRIDGRNQRVLEDTMDQLVV
jgi:hypothetical protein